MTGSSKIEKNLGSILEALKGQSIVLPNLDAIFASWPKEVNVSVDWLDHEIVEWLNRYGICMENNFLNVTSHRCLTRNSLAN